MTSRKITFEADIVQMGNSNYVRIPKSKMDAFGFRKGDTVAVRIEKVQEQESRTD